MVKMLRTHVWSQTDLGPLQNWSQTLLSFASMVIAAPHAMSLCWGPSAIMIYNDSFAPLLGKRHPKAFGCSLKSNFATEWESSFRDTFKAVYENGESIFFEERLFMFEPEDGILLERYFTGAWSPIRDKQNIVAVLRSGLDTTHRVVSERRLKTLREIDIHCSFARSLEQIPAALETALSFNPFDVPFCIIYTCDVQFSVVSDRQESTAIRATSSHSDLIDHLSKGSKSENVSQKSFETTSEPILVTYKLRAVTGLTTSHVLCPDTVEIRLQNSAEGSQLFAPLDEVEHIWPFRQIAEMNTGIDVNNLAPEYFDDLTLPHPKWQRPSAAAVLPIVSKGDNIGSDGVMVAVMIMGLSPHQEFDEAYRSFAAMISSHISSNFQLIRSIEVERERAEELAAANRDRTIFFNSVSHELRTPLTLILGPLDDIINGIENSHDGLKSAHLQEQVTLMRRNCMRLLRLVNGLLDFSRAESGKMTASFYEVALAKFTGDLASTFRSAIEKGNVTYVVDCSHSMRAWVDPDLWEKIVFNLIGNAFKFTLSGVIEVSCKPSKDGKSAVFEVKDSGVGIPPHERLRIFDRFHRVQNQSARSHEGTGIGLALTLELVKLHGGGLECDSDFGIGSTFRVKLPLGSSHLPSEHLNVNKKYYLDSLEPMTGKIYGRGIVDEAHTWISTEDTITGPTSGQSISFSAESNESTINYESTNFIPYSTRGSRVLIVDDNNDMRKYIRKVLSHWYSVIECRDGKEAVRLAVEEKPDLIVSDVMMPELDGFALMRILRSHQETKTIPIILLSARAGENAKVEGLRAGADDYIIKPFSARELVARIHTHVELARLRYELEMRVSDRTKQLAQSELRYRVLSEISPVGVFRLDPQLHLIYTNEKFWDITGCSASNDRTTTSWLGFVHPDDRELLRSLVSENPVNPSVALRRGIEIRWGSHDDFKWSLVNIVEEWSDRGEYVSLVGAMTDTTARKILEQKTLKDSEEMRHQQEQFIDMVMHEMRNPLNGIYHSADIVHTSVSKLRDEITHLQTDDPLKSDTTKLRQFLAAIKHELDDDVKFLEDLEICAQHQKRIADDVLHMSKIQMNILPLSLTAFQPETELQKLLRMFTREAIAKNIVLESKVGKGFSNMNISHIISDPIRIAQILINLLSNAVRFSDKRPNPQIVVSMDVSFEAPALNDSISSAEVGNAKFEDYLENANIIDARRVFLQYNVQDSGVGLTTEEQQHLFRRFQQASHKTFAEYGGVGLGLFISRAIVERLGGRISIESQKDIGTTFKFYITAMATSEKSNGDREDARTGPAFISNAPDNIPKSLPLPIRVLIVEDNRINQNVLIRQLQYAGFESIVANNGVEVN